MDQNLKVSSISLNPYLKLVRSDIQHMTVLFSRHVTVGKDCPSKPQQCDSEPAFIACFDTTVYFPFGFSLYRQCKIWFY